MKLGTPQILIALALVALTAGGCKRAPEKTPGTPAPVLVVALVPAQLRTLATRLSVTGAIAAWQPLAVSPALSGLQVVAVLTDEGQHVAKGQVLARLDDRGLRVQLADAQARLASATASVQKARFPGRSEDVSTARAALHEAETRLTATRAELARFETLFAEGGISSQEIETKRTSLAAASSAAQQARDRLSVLRDGGRSEDVRIAEASAAQARAAVAQVKLQLDQAQVKAPAAGLVLERLVNLGDTAAGGKAMFTLARDNRLEMVGNVAEVDLPAFKPGQKAFISSDALPGLHATGSVRQVSPVLNTQSRLASVRIDLPAHSGFKPGMFARAELSLAGRSVLAVPADAVVSEAGQARVFTVTDGVVSAKSVTVGDSVAGWVPVTSGLTVGTPVVADGGGFLKDGDHVTVEVTP